VAIGLPIQGIHLSKALPLPCSTSTKPASVASASAAKPPRAKDLAAIEAFLDRYWAETGASANTLASYRLDLLIVARWLAATAGPALIALTRPELLDYLAFRSVGTSARTGARTLSSLKTFFGQRVANGQQKENPTNLVTGPKLPRTLPKALSEPRTLRPQLACATKP
jgi:integrase/recombinase XerD